VFIAATLVHYFASSLPVHVVSENGTLSSALTLSRDRAATSASADTGARDARVVLRPELSRAVERILASSEADGVPITAPTSDVESQVHLVADIIWKYCRAGEMNWENAHILGKSLQNELRSDTLCERLLSLYNYVSRAAALSQIHLSLARKCISTASEYLCEPCPPSSAWHVLVCGLFACASTLQSQWTLMRDRQQRRLRNRAREVDSWLAQARSEQAPQDTRQYQSDETTNAIGLRSSQRHEHTKGPSRESAHSLDGSISSQSRERTRSVGGVVAQLRGSHALRRKLEHLEEADDAEW